MTQGKQRKGGAAGRRQAGAAGPGARLRETSAARRGPGRRWHSRGSYRALVQNASPLGSRMGTVDDVADAVEFFTGKLSRWISGAQLLVSGGAT